MQIGIKSAFGENGSLRNLSSATVVIGVLFFRSRYSITHRRAMHLSRRRGAAIALRRQQVGRRAAAVRARRRRQRAWRRQRPRRHRFVVFVCFVFFILFDDRTSLFDVVAFDAGSISSPTVGAATSTSGGKQARR